jgi:peptide/nickel transport system permease protein
MPDKMILYLLKSIRFLIGFLFLALMMVFSFLQHGPIHQIVFRSDAKGNFIDSSPYPPFSVFLLGSDRFGYNLGQMMIQGAKYTIGSIIVVTFMRMLFSLLISTMIYTLKPKYYKVLKTLFEPFSVVPQTIIAFFILASVLWMPMTGFQTSLWQRVLFEFFILVLIAIPNLTMQLFNELRVVRKESFIEASQTLGAGQMYIFFKHMIPHLYEKWILLFGQQFLQVLQLLTHLGYLGLFFGGTIVQYNSDDPSKSVSNEWSGMIAANVDFLRFHQWMLLVPMAFFILTAISVFFINDSVKDYFQKKDRIREQLKSEV